MNWRLYPSTPENTNVSRIDAALADGTRSLQSTSPSADLDARILLQHALSRDHAWLLAHGNETIDKDQLEIFRTLIEQRRQGEPIAYLIGWKEFWSLRMEVDNAVLVPRPETEHLVEHALSLIPREGPFSIVDLGTGSGAVALAVAVERPACEIVATDVSKKALAVASRNAQHLGINNVSFVCGDWYKPLANQRFHMILSNPPYIADGDPCLQTKDIRREPDFALRSGPSGLDALDAIGSRAANHLFAGGWILLEHGYEQQQDVARILRQGGLSDIVCHADYSGHPRITAARNNTGRVSDRT